MDKIKAKPSSLHQGANRLIRVKRNRLKGRAPISPDRRLFARAVVESLLEAGQSALAAGAVDAGVDCLRRAATDAEQRADHRLQARTLMALGTALVHSVRGHDDEGAILLRQAIEWAQRCGVAGLAASAYRELGYVEALAGRRPTAAEHLALALDLATDDDERAGVHGVMGFNLVDWGRVDEGLAQYQQSLEHARRTDNRRRQAWALGVGGWGPLTRWSSRPISRRPLHSAASSATPAGRPLLRGHWGCPLRHGVIWIVP